MGIVRARAIPAAWLIILLLGSLLRLQDVARPFDGRSLSPWREADYIGISRSFARESLDPFHPRVDWRGDSPGYAEMELPAIPWIAGLLDRLFGENERRIRWMSALAGIAALLVFAKLAREWLPPGGALFATLSFSLQPLLIYLAPAMQPDSAMVLLILLAVGRIARFEDSGRTRELILAALFTGAAVLLKAPAALVGLLLIDVVLRRLGWRAALRPPVIAAAACAVIPALAWYWWAHRFWLEYGLSLGLSNETHRLNLAVLRNSQALLGNLHVEVHQVFTWPGVLLAAAALTLRPAGWLRPLRWALAVTAFYVLAGDTSGDRWAFYYHALSAAPAALLMGAGFSGLIAFSTYLKGLGSPRRAAVIRGMASALVIATGEEVLRETFALRTERDEQDDLQKAYACARTFKNAVPSDARIVVSGGPAVDEHGHPVAHNESNWFAWLDRRGMSYAAGELTLDRLEEWAKRPRVFWIARESELTDPTFRLQVETRHRLASTCDGRMRLYELGAGGH